MSSEQESRLARLLLREAFGEVVEKVCVYLLNTGTCTLAEIVQGTSIEQELVKKSLWILIQHQLVRHKVQKKSTVYMACIDSALQRIRFPGYIHAAKVMFGDAGELIIEDILQQGHASMSQNVRRVLKRLEEAGYRDSRTEKIVQEQFMSLVKGHFLQHLLPLAQKREETQLTADFVDEKKQLQLPPLAEAMIGSSGNDREDKSAEPDEPRPKKRKTKESDSQEEVAGEGNALWQVNFDRFQQYFRDEAIVSGVARQVDETAASIMKTILSLASDTPQPMTMTTALSKKIFLHQISEALPSKPKLTRLELEQYLTSLVDQQSAFLQKCEESHGSYVVNKDFKRSSEILCRAAIECVVKERFGAKAFRVFRLLLLKKMLEQKQVADFAMIPSKEAKEILYTLLAEKFVSLQEIPKTPDYAPSRTFYLFSVQLLPVAFMVRERCYKALGNLITRRLSETEENRRLLERSEQHERQLAEAENKEVAEEEMEEVLTPDEKEKVEAVKQSLTKLEHAESQLDETILTISNYIQLHTFH